jgi:hypothetical protein
MAELQKILQPYLDANRANFTTDFSQLHNSSVNSARSSAGALAAQKGYNPTSYVNSAGQRASNALTPQFFSGYNKMSADNLGTLFGLTAQNQQFKYGVTQDSNNDFYKRIGLQMQAQQYYDQPDIWDYITKAALTLGGGLLGGPAGAGAGTVVSDSYTG